MANSGVDGTFIILGVGGDPEGFTIEVWDDDFIFGEIFLGRGKTNRQGGFQVRYKPNIVGSRDLIIRLYDPVRRLVNEETFKNISDTIFQRGDLIKLVINVQGWRVTMDGISPSFLSTDNQIEPLVDNEKAWARLGASIVGAQEKICLSQLHFELDYMFTEFVPDPPLSLPTTGVKLEVELEMAAAGPRGVSVQILMNDFKGIGYPADTIASVMDYFSTTAAEVRGFERPLREGPMHAKLAVIDKKTAYSIGSPLIQEYFDRVNLTSHTAHEIDDPRRGEMTWPFNAIRVPVHDVSLFIEGSAAADIDLIFQLLWDKVFPSLPTTPPIGGSNAIQVTLTLPGDVFPDFPNGATGILESYQRAIRNASDFIYLENQYFTEPAIATSLVLALQANPNLQVIMVFNPKVDLPGYQEWQRGLIQLFLDALIPQERKRIGIFSLWSHQVSGTVSRLMRNYVHSKVAIVDDKWATVGSANLDGLSLTKSQYIPLPLMESPFFALATGRDKLKRSIEVNAAIYNNVEGLPPSQVSDELRRTLWAEHLGYDTANHPNLLNPSRPSDGWLNLWNRIASRKLASLNSIPPMIDHARILPWPNIGGLSPYSDEEFLKRMGISLLNNQVEAEVRSFNFNNGKWF